MATPAPTHKKRDNSIYRERSKQAKQMYGRRRRTFSIHSQYKLNAWVRDHPDATDEEIRAWVKEAKLYTPGLNHKPISRNMILIARHKAKEAKEGSSSCSSQEEHSPNSQRSNLILDLLHQDDSNKENNNTSFAVFSNEVFEANKKSTAHLFTPKPPCGQNHEPCNCFKWDDEKLEWVRRLITK